ncbi:aromatic amino acid DMT transporter YddG [Ketogulonicigenium vulgare]|uniref:Permease of drug/metabolite transporter n=1 Tax=Ketogulonicigenium vulgare (strain WSH-001) TaxID=759362 RepID=F9YA54_KETVW|nr:aromatic amino acid DMT transporter YddG [Ketogulonicigenium vulgare]ADO43166.1 Inner membrane protein yddG [Ketogulonicigenium vulgare Y25]AEM41465.1 Permease of drug/metabolite transporter [Ketogulonicigenium vulgare WSH-001]ALJ81596.1 multidrug DMT transporter permease [Ketogulonicigenium vulgare]ANW34274.1 multidrug DMT transporter permease [Ketogulonicigenium vulgare]AOZ55205.1 inner membrane protein yddG [Ketogulonicigenium vulgare]
MFGVAAAGFSRGRIDPPTLVGMSAILMWSATVGLYRNISEIFGPIGGSALIFTVSGIVALIHAGPKAFRGHSPRYLLIGGAMFVTYEIALALAVGFAQTRAQSVEVGLINYLWPSFTIALAIWAGHARAGIMVIPGILICLLGVFWAATGSANFSLAAMVHNIGSNPLPYILAFIAAITWPLYTILTKGMAQGRSAVPLFLLATAALLWVYYGVSDQPTLVYNSKGAMMVLTFGVLTTLAYSAWTYGVNHGNLTLMATASYFSPLLSVMLSSVLLSMVPGLNFWLGASLVTAGSLICLAATKR